MTTIFPRVIHVAPRVQARGGIESILALHRQLPQRQAFVALFDRNPPAEAGYVNLNLNWRTPLWEMRRRFARAMAPQAGTRPPSPGPEASGLVAMNRAPPRINKVARLSFSKVTSRSMLATTNATSSSAMTKPSSKIARRNDGMPKT